MKKLNENNSKKESLVNSEKNTKTASEHIDVLNEIIIKINSGMKIYDAIEDAVNSMN